MNKWERKLRREGLGMARGRDARLTYGLEPRLDPTYGLVSPLYALSLSGDYITDEERRLRARNALKCLIKKHGHATISRGLSLASVSKSDEPVLAVLKGLLSQLPA